MPYVRLAIIAIKTHRAASGLPDAERALKLAPQSSLAHQVLARIFTDLGKNDQAAKELETANSLKPEKPQADATVARAYARVAVAAPVKPPADSSASFNELSQQATAAAKAGHADEAIQLYQRALALQPKSDRAWLDLGTIYYATR
ncbi:MAG: hypothetical protein DMG68_10920, partial [Acidobacteria bacterium]